ncbi:MAG TPA: hydrogen peroxide-dependent heme synthase [Candidatus Limnocylindrales bacterium]|nr:hydrogen peroxide-dependent heme synthase [Candidatus Limnocylindrales bacterium]
MSSGRTARPAIASGTDPGAEANATVRYAAWVVYARTDRPPGNEASAIAGLTGWAEGLAADDVILRGAYDVSGLRAGADLMLWLHGPSVESLQAALRAFRRTSLGNWLNAVWSAMGAHRRAEFSADHLPSFMQGREPRRWLCVYPFARSYDWYLLPEDERREMLREHGLAGRAFAGVQANTVAAFGLNDWEWILALEADNPQELVDLLRALRATQARRHVREEVPFHTGRRLEIGEVIEILR